MVQKEGNVLFHDALNTFYLRLYGFGHMAYDHSDKTHSCHYMGYTFIDNLTDFATQVVESWLEWEQKEGRKEGNVLFNKALNTFYLQLYVVSHMVKEPLR